MTQQVQQNDRSTAYAEGLAQLLTTGFDDDKSGQHEQGLLEWYPQLVAWTAQRGQGRGGGRAGGGGLPLNSDAHDFLTRTYWANPDLPMPSTEQAQNPDHYRPGVEMTVLGLVDAARRALGFEEALQRHRGTGHAMRPDVRDGLRWLAAIAPTLVRDHPTLARTIYDEALRLIVHVRSMLWGNAREATHSQCPHCHQVESVISDGERAVCITPICRRPDGTRYCWQLLDGTWTEVNEPDVDGRGQVTDDEVARWGTA